MAKKTSRAPWPFDNRGYVSTTEQLDPNSSDEAKSPHWINTVGRAYKWVRTLSTEGRTADTFVVKAVKPVGSPVPTNFPNGELVLKVPKFDFSTHSLQETVERFEQIRRHANFEFRDASVKLNAFPTDKTLPVPHANPILDKFNVLIDDLPAPLTVQRLLSDRKYTRLRDWMNSGYGQSQQGRDEAFIYLATSIAHAIEIVHARRVIHGDINPDNVFLSDWQRQEEASLPKAMPRTNCSNSVSAMLIDLGEAFPSYPGRYYRPRREHPFLAPECLSSSRRSELVDVYSFGRLMIYLITQDDAKILDAAARRITSPHKWVEQLVKLYRGIPTGRRLINLIARCLSQAPVDRPRMSDVVDELKEIAIRNKCDCSPCQACASASKPSPSDARAHADERAHAKKVLRDCKDRLLQDAGQVGDQRAKLLDNPIINALLELEVDRLAAMYSGLARGALEVTGTREHILTALAQIFYRLKSCDSLTVATSLDMWQREGLGLGGRLGTALLHVAHEGAMLRRALVVSVEELGLPFVEFLLTQLAIALDPSHQEHGTLLLGTNGRIDSQIGETQASLKKLSETLADACGAYCSAAGIDVYNRSGLRRLVAHVAATHSGLSNREYLAMRLICPSVEQQARNVWHQNRLQKILWTIRSLCRKWDLQRHLDRRPLETKRRSGRSPDTEFWADRRSVGGDLTQGSILFAILPVGTDVDVEKERADNPAAIISWGDDQLPDERNWLLATIDGIGSRTDVQRRRESGLHLDRLRIHSSVHGDPRERRLYLARLFERSVNMGACHEVLLRCVVAARKKYREWEKNAAALMSAWKGQSDGC